MKFIIIINDIFLGSRFVDEKVRTGYVCKMILHISNVSSEDFSSYKCVAVNALGETDGIIKLYGTQIRFYVLIEA